jgi:hypothetical protein
VSPKDVKRFRQKVSGAGGGLFGPEKRERLVTRELLLVARCQCCEERQAAALCMRPGYQLAIGLEAQTTEGQEAKSQELIPG